MVLRSISARWVLVTVFVFAASITNPSRLSAQQAPAEALTPTIRANTRLILVDVVVTDKKNAAILGLKAQDFSLEENGKKQKISVFTTPEEAAKGTAPPSLPPGVYSNSPEYRSPGGPITVFVLDAANTPFIDQAYGRLQMLKYVQEQNTPHQRVAIFTLTDGLQLLQDFTSDPQVLVSALQQYQPQQPVQEAVKSSAGAISPADPGSLRAGTASLIQEVTNQVRNFQSVQLAYLLERRTETTLYAMRSLARALAGMPGRKEVIWLTAAFPFDLMPEDRSVTEAEASLLQQGVRQAGLETRASGSMAETGRLAHREEIRQAAAQLAAAQVALYPVDVRGLASGMEISFGQTNLHSAMDISSVAQVKMSDIASDQETMRALASETGGKAYVNQNEIRVGIEIAVADNAAAYTLGYYPEDKKWNGKYRNLKVKVNHEGAQTRHRKGYFAVDTLQTKDRRPDQELAEALNTSIPSTLIFFKAQVKRPEKDKLHVAFLVDAHSLSASDSAGKKKLNLDLYAAVFSPSGKMLSNGSLKVDQELAGDVYQQVLQKGMLVPMDIGFPPGGNNQLRLAVRDNVTGNIGTINALLTE
ncbi:MAG: hypothetical protein DMG68_14040 [Acidobacteria bacterium]|nr:MAG: hypothetical protein DMG68_14040 [Acidobacteriota bacterium]